ncbi:hypothetical protein P7H21_19715 [Paenibacillus larvae]|nr:hypothetical protein [Paenibacillus larvae]MDT2305720.1 hypothetical protein [Paenibacillus larvae]
MITVIAQIAQAVLPVLVQVIQTVFPIVLGGHSGSDGGNYSGHSGDRLYILNITQVVILIISEVVQAVFPCDHGNYPNGYSIVIEILSGVASLYQKCGGARHSNHFADCTGCVPCRDGDH